MSSPRLLAAALAALVLSFAPLAAEPPAPETVCRDHARRIEIEQAIPRGLMLAIALTESGRWLREQGISRAWPWTVASGEESYYLDSKEEAIATVERLRKAGRRNIDVGCMQVNLHYHPDAFASLEAAFDPESNVAYAGRFLKELHVETRSWARAIARYHTRDHERGSAYRARVYSHWQSERRRLAQADAPALTPEAQARREAVERVLERRRPQRVGGEAPAGGPAIPLVRILRGG